MMKKTIWSAFAAAMTCAAAFCNAAFAGNKEVIRLTDIYANEEGIKVVKERFTADGPTLLFSDSPEEVFDKGILYRDTVSGQVRLFFHHVNAMEGNKKLAVMIRNKNNLRPLQYRIIRRGINDPSHDYLLDGKQAELRYFGEEQEITQGELGFYDSAELITGKGFELETQKLLTGIVDLEISAPAEISVLMCELQTDLDIFNDAAKILPIDAHPLRGTFANADWHHVLDKPLNIKKEDVYMLAMATPDKYAQGIDSTTGLAAENYGNYGVIYMVDFEIKGKNPVQFLFNPVGGNFAGYGVLEHNGERRLIGLPEKQLCLGATMEEALELGVLENGSYRFIWSPPGASNLPVRVYWRQA